MTDGLDVSAHQTATPDLSAVDFLFARATYGTFPDNKYGQHVAKARAAGLVVGAYHFGRAGDPIEQANAFIAAAAGNPDLYVLDLESDGGNPAMSLTQARAFIVAVKRVKVNHKVGLYHSDSGFPSLGQDFNWVAKWSPTPPARPWAFWQYRGSPLDLDRYHGTVAQLRAFAGIVAPPIARHIRAAANAKGYTTYRIVGGRAIPSGTLPTKGFGADGLTTCELLSATQADGTGTIALVRITSGGYARKILHRTERGITIT
jgi:hypothetical protein